jgi:hypothetical protein
MWAMQNAKQENASTFLSFSSTTIGFITIGLREYSPNQSATPAAADLLSGVVCPEVGGGDKNTNTKRR